MLKKFLVALGVLFLLFVAVLIFGATRPDFEATSKARHTIEYCWEQQSLKSLDDQAKRLRAAQCEAMEADFVAKYGSKP